LNIGYATFRPFQKEAIIEGSGMAARRNEFRNIEEVAEI